MESPPRAVHQPISISTDKADPYPLTPGQHSLWFLQKIAPDSAAYNIAAAVRIISDVDADAIRRSFQILTDRHASLRTSFVVLEGAPCQALSHLTQADFSIEDVSGCDPQSLNDRLAREANLPFDLEKDPVFRVRLYRVAPREHLMLLVLHHIVADLWSMAIILRELGEIYSSEVTGVRHQLKPCNVQYSDYVRWQRNVLESDGEALWSYWKDRLASAPHALSLQTDRPRPATPSHRGARITFRIAPEDAQGLQKLCRAAGVTTYVGLLSAFMVLMHRYTGQPDILIGSPTAGRSRPELAGLVGYLVNPLVMRGRFEEKITVSDLLHQTGQMVLAAFEHESYPFPLIVQRLHREWDPSRSPVFQVFFAFQNAAMLESDAAGLFALGLPGACIKFGDLVLESMHVERRASQFDLAIAMAESQGTLAGAIEFDADLFDAITISRMVENFKTLLRSFGQQADAPITRLSILSATETGQLLRDWNDTRVEYPEYCDLAQVFERQALNTPDRIAVVFESDQLSYRMLGLEADRISKILTAHGAGPEIVVGISMERSIELVAGLLGILTSGAAFLPIEPGEPADRLRFMIEESGLEIIVAQPELAEGLSNCGVRVIPIGSRQGIEDTESKDWIRPTPLEDNLAYVIYTSGSTGRPKGAMNTHKGIINRLLWMQHEYSLNESDCVLQKTPFTFDVSVWELFWPLITGARLVVAKPGGHRDTGYLADTILKQQITTLHFVPSMLAVFLDDPRVKSCRLITRVICSGEELGLELERKFFDLFACGLHNLYGPTEAAVDVTFWQCDRSGLDYRVPIGRPIANTQMYIVDPFEQLSPVGAAGQLLIAGTGVARGYIDRPDMTAERFAPNPFDDSGGSRVYRTGDLARFASGGEIEFLGRTDYQVKVRG
ncbi:MAG: non-ribosomal peptide synthetase, partial [Blastocatellia bacterium]